MIWMTLDIKLIITFTLSSATLSISISWQIPTAVEYPVVESVGEREVSLRVGRESILLPVGSREYSSKYIY